jgi:AcrR family transcriptional regulator
MTTGTDASSARRAPLTRERVLAAAVAIADESGIDALSMRRLAGELGVKAMSLYNHVANKDDVLDAIVETVAGEIAIPADGTEWKAAIRESTISAHETLLRHPWASDLWMRQAPGPSRLRYMELLLATMRDAGFSEDLTYHAYHILTSHFLGYTVQALNYRALAKQDVMGMAARFLETFPADDFPHFAEHVQQHIESRHDDVNAFELGLDLILDGIERMRDAQAD